MSRLTTILLAVVVTIGAGCDSLTGASDIEYRVRGTAARASITYQSSAGGTSQTTDSLLPWSYTYKADRDAFLYVSAQNSGQTGCVVAEIIRKGSTLESVQSCGAFAIATASGNNR